MNPSSSTRLVLCAAILLALICSAVPLTIRAATLSPAPVAPLASHLDEDEEEDEDDDEDWRNFRGYSSSLRRKINGLDDDEVEELPIPILLGVTRANITPDFGDPRGGGTREHEGQDILAPRGAIIAASTEGVVTRTGKGSSAGTYVYVAAPGGETFRYMHLDRIADGIKSGTELEVGDIIGYVGNTGNAAGGPTHLHFEIRDGRRAIDPYPRLTREFTLKERITALTNLIEMLRKELARKE